MQRWQPIRRRPAQRGATMTRSHGGHLINGGPRPLGNRPAERPLTVKMRRRGSAMSRPVYLQQRTYLVTGGTTVECHKETSPPAQARHRARARVSGRSAHRHGRSRGLRLAVSERRRRSLLGDLRRARGRGRADAAQDRSRSPVPTASSVEQARGTDKTGCMTSVRGRGKSVG